MSLSAPKPPAAPALAANSAAHTQSTKETALYNFGLNKPNWNTPLGNLNYDLDTSDPNAPRTSASVNLSPEQQQLFDIQNQQSLGLANLANSLQGRVGDTLNQPIPGQGDINKLSQEAQDAYYKKQTGMLDKQYGDRQAQLESKLANQGITLGSEAWRNAQDDFSRDRTNAYDSAQQNAILQGPQNAQQLYSLSAASRQLPLNEFNALRTGSQVQMPQFQGYNPVNSAGTNVAGNINQGYQNQLNSYNQQVAGQNSTMSSLFGLGGSLGSAWIMSDRRLKTNIKLVGKTPGGIPVYEYVYRGTDKKRVGPMAQDVEKIIPSAVIKTASGYKAVDYSQVR